MLKPFLRQGVWFLGLFVVFGLLTTPVLAANEVKIGVLYPLTGGAAAEGRELRAGAELAIEIANKVFSNISMDMGKNKGIKEHGRRTH